VKNKANRLAINLGQHCLCQRALAEQRFMQIGFARLHRIRLAFINRERDDERTDGGDVGGGGSTDHATKDQHATRGASRLNGFASLPGPLPSSA
jgi:hypothetical protein